MPKPPKFGLPNWIELQYQAAISRMLKDLLPMMLPGETFEQWVGNLAGLSNRQDLFEQAQFLSTRMVTQVNAQNARSWREASAKSQRSRMLYAALKEEMAGATGLRFRNIVNENAATIRSIPLEVATMLNRHIAEAQQSGLRPEAIGAMLRVKMPQFSKSKIALVARTQAAAASSSLTEARAMDVGLHWFEWLTSEDQRVRSSHDHMEGVLVNWNELPSPEQLIGKKSTLGHYAPGRCPNCRCIPSPILTLDDVSWPHKVYTGGRIVRMTRIQFQQFSGIPGRRKAA